MERKEPIKIGLSTVILCFIILILIVMAVFLIIQNNNLRSSKITSEEENMQISSNIVNDVQNNQEVSYVILEVEDTEADGLEYKSKKVEDKDKIISLMKIIDSATAYQENGFIPDFGDCPPVAKVYLSNGEKYTVAAGDEIEDGGNTVNLMTKWNDEDGSNKTLYKVNAKLGKCIKDLYGTDLEDKTNVTSSSTELSNTTNTQSSTGTKLIQFDTEFYNLKDIALEYREIGNIKNYKDFEYDLDGDGKKDKITVKNIGKDELRKRRQYL